LQKLINAGFEVIDNPYKRKLTKEELLALIPGVEGLISGLETLDREVLEKSCLKVVSRCGSGLSNVDLAAAKKLGILVKNTPLAPVNAVAELTVGCLIILLRQVMQMNTSLHRKEWKKIVGRQLSDMTVAIVGFGNIGRRVARFLLAFGAKIIAVDPVFSGIIDNVEIVSLEKALKQADIISIHTNGESCLLGEKEFSLMKHEVFILNVARGGLIDEQMLKKALDCKLVSGAWLDTFSVEPYTGIFCDYPQVLLTPHVGSYTLECRKNMEMEAVNNLIAGFDEYGK